jgi:hypothetical protein
MITIETESYLEIHVPIRMLGILVKLIPDGDYSKFIGNTLYKFIKLLEKERSVMAGKSKSYNGTALC